jgi:di/tricarboxylate transporter
MVMGPGGYPSGDYAKLGFSLRVWPFVAVTSIVPIFWSF